MSAVESKREEVEESWREVNERLRWKTEKPLTSAELLSDFHPSKNSSCEVGGRGREVDGFLEIPPDKKKRTNKTVFTSQSRRV